MSELTKLALENSVASREQVVVPLAHRKRQFDTVGRVTAYNRCRIYHEPIPYTEC